MNYEPLDGSYPPDPLEPEVVNCRQITVDGIFDGMIVYHDPKICSHTGPYRYVRWGESNHRWTIIDIEDYR